MTIDYTVGHPADLQLTIGQIRRGKCERVGVKKNEFFLFLINILSATDAFYYGESPEGASQRGLPTCESPLANST